jgi:hypothetical protein
MLTSRWRGRRACLKAIDRHRSSNPGALTCASVDAIHAIDPNRAVSKLRTFDGAMSKHVARDRLTASVFGAFAASGLLSHSSRATPSDKRPPSPQRSNPARRPAVSLGCPGGSETVAAAVAERSRCNAWLDLNGDIGVSAMFRGGGEATGAHAAVHQVAKSRRLQAPATISTCSERSPVSGDLFAFVAALSIAARFPLSSILSTPSFGVRTIAEVPVSPAGAAFSFSKPRALFPFAGYQFAATRTFACRRPSVPDGEDGHSAGRSHEHHRRDQLVRRGTGAHHGNVAFP